MGISEVPGGSSVKTREELEPLIIKWADSKGLIKHTTGQAIAQFGKTEEEIGELTEAINVYNGVQTCLDDGHPSYEQSDVDAALDQVRLEAGDVLVTLVIQKAIQELKGNAPPSYKRWLQSIAHEKTLKESIAQLKKALLGKKILQVDKWTEVLAYQVESLVKPYGLALDECLNAAWEKIRDRTGQTIDGVFVKDS